MVNASDLAAAAFTDRTRDLEITDTPDVVSSPRRRISGPDLTLHAGDLDPGRGFEPETPHLGP
jgi:hypothetical protein